MSQKIKTDLVIDGTVTATTFIGSISGALSDSTTSTQNGYFGNIYLYDDSTPSHYLGITNGANLTAARTLTINTGDADRTLTLTGNASITGTNTGDQTTITGNAGSATILQTARTINGTSFNGSANITTASWGTARSISLTGDVTGTVASVDGSANISITTTIAANSVALGTDTTGNYVAGITAGQGISVTGTAGEGWSPTVGLTALDLTLFPTSNFKKSVKAATTGNITLSAPQTIDGIALIAGDRVLVKDQTTSAENGIYIVQAAAWTRSTAADGSTEIDNAIVAVDQGTTNGGQYYTNTFKTTDVVGTTAMPWYRIPIDSPGYTYAFGISGNAGSATILQTTRTINGVNFNGSANITITANTPNTLTRGTYLTGSNFNGSAATTWAVDATSANTASKVVARDASGNFSAGTITASLSGNASTATSAATWTTARNLTIGSTAKSVNGSANVSWSLAEIGALGATAKAADSTLFDGVTKPTNFGATSQSYTVIPTGGWAFQTNSSVFGQPSSVGGPGGSGYWFTLGRRDISGGYGGIWGGYESGNHWFGYNGTGTNDPTWERIITSANIGSQSVASATSAATLTTARTINGTSFNGSADITTANWGTARSITLTGDVTGSVASYNGSGNLSITTTIAANSVALGTDTTGNYVAGATAGQGITITGTAGEGWSPTIALTALDLTLFPTSNYKKSVKAATTANITLSAPQTIDGIALVAGDRVLVKNQTTASQNGIYIVQAAAWTRSVAADGSNEIDNALVAVDQGTVNGGHYFTNVFKTTDVVGTTAMPWYKKVFENGGSWGISITGSAATLTNGRLINGTSFNGSGDITTANWGTARSINGVSVNGSTSYTLEPYVERDDTSNLTRYLTFVDDATAGYKRLNMDDTLNYNPLTGFLTATSFVGGLVGNANTATTLATARTINGTSFNGSANITTNSWGTSRNLTIGASTKAWDGSANLSFTLAEIGAGSGSASFPDLINKDLGTGSYITSGDYRAPIFYDSTDVNYYLHPNGFSNLSSGRFNSNLEVLGTLTYGAFSTGTNGYTRLPNGFIIQWARYTQTNDSTTTVSYPLAFPTAALVVVGSKGRTSTGVSTQTNAEAVSLNNASTFWANANDVGGTGYVLFIIAIGY